MELDKFEDLLTEDGRGTQELDGWLHKNVWYPMNREIKNTVLVANYTAGVLYDPIICLAEDYLKHFNLRRFSWTPEEDDSYQWSIDSSELSEPVYGNDLKLVLAEALFDAHQNREEETKS